MKELVGQCELCHKNVYCMDGFLNGVHQDNHLCCFDCASK